MTEQVTALTEMMRLDVAGMDPKRLAALNALVSGKVPESAVSRRKGRAGKTFSYLKHIYGNDLLRDAFGYLWGYEVLSTQVYDDHSATALVKLTMYVPLDGGQYLEVPTTTVGAHEDVSGKMCSAFMAASAASRGLCKCLMRRFGVGREFYGDEVSLSPGAAWTTLKEFGARHSVTEKDITAKMKEIGISGEKLVDRFQEAYDAVSELASSARPADEKTDKVLEAAEELGAEVKEIEETETPFDDVEPEPPTEDADLPGRQVAQHNFEVLYKWCSDEAGVRSNDARAIWEKVCGKIAWLSHNDATLREIITAWLATGTDEAKEALREHYAI